MVVWPPREHPVACVRAPLFPAKGRAVGPNIAAVEGSCVASPPALANAAGIAFQKQRRDPGSEAIRKEQSRQLHSTRHTRFC